MTTTAALILLAIVVGIAVALQGQFVGTMDRLVGTPTSVFITYGIGGLLAAIVWLTQRAPFEAPRRIPWYCWFAGGLGVLIVGGIAFAAPRLGLSRTIVITIASQLAAAVLIDHFGILGATQRSFDLIRGVGVALTVLGAWLVVKQ